MARGLSQNALGGMLTDPVDGGQIDKIEKRTDNLDLGWIFRMAEAFGVDPVEIVEDRPLAQPAVSCCDAQSFSPKPGDNLATLVSAESGLWEVKTNSLDELGIEKGSLVLVDVSKQAVEGVQTADPVLVQYKDANSGKEFMLLREFIEPSLLVTNSRADNAPPLNLKTADAQIKGFVRHHIRPQTRATR